MYAGAPGTFLLEECLRGGMATMTWFLREIGDRFEAKADVEAYEAEAREVPPGSDGLVLVPYWNGVMSPYWNGGATGAIVGWHWGHGKAELFRAVEEGIAFEFRLAMDGVQKATGQTIEEYVILGGGSNSDLWCQIMADVLGAPVVRAHTVEATNLGAGILGAYGLDWYDSVEDAAAAMTDVAERFEPDSRTSGVYDRIFTEVYTPLYPALRDPLDRLARIRADGDASAGGVVSAGRVVDPRRGRDGLRARDPAARGRLRGRAVGHVARRPPHRGRARGTRTRARTCSSRRGSSSSRATSCRGPRRRRPRGHRRRLGRRPRGGSAGTRRAGPDARRAAHEQGLLARRGGPRPPAARGAARPRRRARGELPPVVAVGGPCKANEVAAGRWTASIFGCADRSVAEEAAASIRTDAYRAAVTDDEPGVEICAPMKNVYAIALGLADGLEERDGEPYHDLKAATFARALQEMVVLSAMVGARRETAMGLAGAGDLEVTGLSGRNKVYGSRIGRGEQPSEALDAMAAAEQTVEGVRPRSSPATSSTSATPPPGTNCRCFAPCSRSSTTIPTRWRGWPRPCCHDATAAGVRSAAGRATMET